MRDRRPTVRRTATALFAGSLVLGLSTLLAPHDVEACGGFFSRASLGGAPKPSLAYEQVLLVHDPRTEKEHFVREIAFRGGAESFGFVVPTPTRPEVAKVERSPFNALRTSFPFLSDPPGGGGGQGIGNGHGRLGSGAGVTVLEVSKVGSFTAFILAANDETGLATWLRDNGLASTPEADVWLAHYVRMKFFYVAMRYDPPTPGDAGKADSSLRAETIRISFSTPLPYYPYFEPRPPALPATDSPPARLLEMWVVSPELVTPIGARTTVDGKTSWIRPMREGRVHWDAEQTQMNLPGALGDELRKLLPASSLVVQTFQDQKYSREGYGDVLFAPVRRAPLDPAKVAKLQPLLGILDPALVPGKGGAP